MQKSIKIIASIIGILILLVAAAIAALITLVNPNDFKANISHAVYQHTGRTLSLNGPLRWTFFPWLGLQINQAELGSAPGAHTVSLIDIQQADIRVALLPLFKGKLTEASISNAHIIWRVPQNNQSIDISDLSLHSKALKRDQASPFELDCILKSAQPAINGDMHFKGTITLKTNQQYILQSQFHSNNLQLTTLKLRDVTAQINAQNNLIALNPITAKLYQGDYAGNLSLQLQNKNWQISSDVQLKDIQVESLLQDLIPNSHLKLAGADNLQAHFSSTGNDSMSLLNHLNGQGNTTLSNGILRGIDIPRIVNMGKSLLNGKAPAAQTGPKQTDFGTLSASWVIQNGIITNNDLLLQAPQLQANGKGTINLILQQLNYQIMAQPIHPDTHQPDGIAIPVKISGPFANLTIHPDFNAIVQNQIQQQLDKNKDKIKKRVNIIIGKRLNNALGDQLKQQLNNLLQH